MAIEGAKITDIQTLKYVLLAREQRLDRIVEAQHDTLAAIVHHIVATQELVGFVTQIVIAVRGAQLGHVLAQRTHIGVDSHVVVVEDDEQVGVVNRRIIESLKCHAAADARITYHGHHTAVGVALQFSGNAHAQCRRDAV